MLGFHSLDGREQAVPFLRVHIAALVRVDQRERNRHRRPGTLGTSGRAKTLSFEAVISAWLRVPDPSASYAVSAGANAGSGVI